MAAIGIHHVALTVNDWARSKAFYSEVLCAIGAKEVMGGEGTPHKDSKGHWCGFAAPAFMLTLWEAKPNLRGNPFRIYNVGLHHVAFSAASRADVDTLFGIEDNGRNHPRRASGVSLRAWLLRVVLCRSGRYEA